MTDSDDCGSESIRKASVVLGAAFLTAGSATGIYFLQRVFLGLSPLEALPLVLIVLGVVLLGVGHDSGGDEDESELTAGPDEIEEKYNE